MCVTVQAKVLPQGGAFVFKGARGKDNMSKDNIDNTVIQKEKKDGDLNKASRRGKLSWEDAYKEMARVEQGEWDDWQKIGMEMETHL